jgi:hypothetical protein
MRKLFDLSPADPPQRLLAHDNLMVVMRQNEGISEKMRMLHIA